MSVNHSPGPWSVVDGYYPSFRELHGASFRVSVVMSAPELTENDYLRRSADLSLIAAAPLLLDALNQWAAAERDGDAGELENARASRDAAIAAAS